MFDESNKLLTNAIDTITFLEELIPSIGDEMNTVLKEAIELARNLSEENQATLLIKYSEYGSYYEQLELARGIYSRLKGERFEPFPMITLTELIENIKQEQGGVN